MSLSISDSTVPKKFKITKVAEDDWIQGPVQLWDIRAKLEEYNTFLEMNDCSLLVDGIKTLNPACNVVNGLQNFAEVSFATS